jgi:hypothetical protein
MRPTQTDTGQPDADQVRERDQLFDHGGAHMNDGGGVGVGLALGRRP